ncbi:hypothetical protein [Streptomyces sp. NPDC058667]|uniref:hypothetical protein n=1 Tax=Streptomyces sp. NPDC058667 TaxID=3346588 RepID=UPI0036478813
MTPPHRKSWNNSTDWYEEIYERQRKAHSSRRIRVEHGSRTSRTGEHSPATTAAAST